MLKTLLFIIVVFFLVRLISRLFLKPKKKGAFRFFYQAFKNVREQQKKQQKQTQNKGGDNRLDNIEEAEYEEIKDEDSDTSK
jgi:ribosomal protein S7